MKNCYDLNCQVESNNIWTSKLHKQFNKIIKFIN